MIGVTVGVGGYRGLAEQAAQSFSQLTGLRCIILGDKEYEAAGLKGQLPELLKLRVWDFVDANEVLLFDADMVCVRPWDPRSMSPEATMVATRDWIWRSGIVKEAEKGAVPLNEYFLASLMILNRDHHREMLRTAEQLFPHIPSNVMAQTAINAARSRLGIPLRFLDRRYNWSLFGEGNLHSKAAPIVAHYNSNELRAKFTRIPAVETAGEVDSEAFAQLGDRWFRYTRVGWDERPIFLRSDGTIGEGGGSAERFWFASRSAQGRVLTIGSETTVTCLLTEHSDGIWRGHWVDHERMGIELTIHRAQAIIDHVQFTGVPRAGAEIGVFRGESSRLMLSGMSDLSLYMIDAWKTPKVDERYWQDPHMRRLSQSIMDEALLLALRTTDFAHTRRIVLVTDQVKAAGAVDDKSLSFVFIDSDHSGPGVREAVETWWPKLKVGGCMLGHDFDHPDFPEVRPTVMALGSELGCAIGVLSDRVWFFSPKT